MRRMRRFRCVTDASDPASVIPRLPKLEVNEGAFLGPTVVEIAERPQAERMVHRDVRTDHNVQRLAAPQREPLEHAQQRPRMVGITRQMCLDQVVAFRIGHQQPNCPGNDL